MRESDKTMYFKATPAIFENARGLRKKMTTSEKLLWEKLKGKQICGLRFRRQHPIDIFIADFYCHEVKLVIEIDGEIHSGNEEYDDGRTAKLEKYDITVIRFKNSEVENDIGKVINEIKITVYRILKSPTWGI